jgi:3-phosphoshikimate 1-carboxyvinyltransferase
MRVIITPNKLKGDVVIPPSKSLSHRAIIAAGLARGESKISNIIYSKDILATISAMRSLGVEIKEFDDYLIIKGNKLKRVNDVIDANESGSTIRFIIPIALTVDEKITFVGHNNLVNRPLDTFFEIFDNQNIKYEKEDKYLPLTVYSGIKPGEFNIRGDVSSQFITGLLYALPLLNGDSVINITTDLESKGYIDLTLDVLKMFGVNVINENYKKFIVKGNQEYKPFDYEVEGDYSQAAFFLEANMLGAEINLLKMNKDSNQGDKKILNDIKDFGGELEFKDNKLVLVNKNLKPATIDFAQSPDLGPALTVLASLIPGESNFINAKRLRIKECDRITCMKEEIEKLGGNIKELPDGMIINGVNRFHGGVCDSHNDHRVVMSLAMATLMMDGDLVIENYEAINKSFPHFFKLFESLGGKVRYED